MPSAQLAWRCLGCSPACPRRLRERHRTPAHTAQRGVAAAGLHFTYPHDKRRAREQAAAARGDAARAAADVRDGAADPEDGVEAGASPLKGALAAEHGTEMARLIRPHSHESVVGPDE